MLKRLFIKNYKQTDKTEVRNKYGKVAGIFGIISNLFLGIIKLIIGSISNSVSIMADAVNNLADTATSAITIMGFKLASKRPTQVHPYGYARYEYVSGFAIATLMLIMGLTFAKESIVKIIHPENLIINNITFIILFIAIVGKVLQMLVYLDFAKAIKSNTLKANAVDTRNDIISTTAILISMFIMERFNINIDGYLGLVVSTFVIISSVSMIKEVLQPLIGILPTKEQVDEIINKILSYEYVQGLHDLVVHNYGVHNDFVTVHVEIDSTMDMLEAHDLIDNIERDFKENLGIDLTIHMDPVVLGNEKVDNLKQLVINTIKQFDNELDIHDFRIVEGTTHTNILFDCVVPYEKEYTVNDIVNYLRQNIKPENEKYYYVIEIDRPYC